MEALGLSKEDLEALGLSKDSPPFKDEWTANTQIKISNFKKINQLS